MRVNPGDKVAGAIGGGGGTEEKAADPLARAAQTKLAYVSLIPRKRKSVKQMMWDSMVQDIVSCFCSKRKKKKKKMKDDKKSKTSQA